MLVRKHQIILWIVGLLLLGSVIYFLLTPDLLAFQTRVIAVREAYRNNQSVIETLRFTEQIENIRVKYGTDKRMTDKERFALQNEVRRALDSKQDIQELINYLRIFTKAMYLSTNGTGTYAGVYHLTLTKIRDDINKGIVDRQEITKIKDELNLQGMDSAEFDAILANEPFP